MTERLSPSTARLHRQRQRPDGMTTFDASAYADNAYHRVDVEKNGHTYKARYFFPNDTEETQLLERISDVPFELSSSMLNYQRLLTDGETLSTLPEIRAKRYPAMYLRARGRIWPRQKASRADTQATCTTLRRTANSTPSMPYTTNDPQAENPIYSMLAWLYRYDAAAGAWESLGDPFAVDGLASTDAVQAGTSTAG